MPDFIAVGPPRTATTWLQRILEHHVALPAGTKETDFFGGNYALGLEWYHSHFRDCAPEKKVGEICPTYFDSPVARERIALHLPQCRIVCTLRDPVERMYSHYRLLRHEGLVRHALSFEEMLARERRWSGPGNLLGASRYATHVHEWQKTFGSANVLVLIHDDLEADPQAFLDRICRHIGAPPIVLASLGLARGRINPLERAPRSWRLAARARRIKFWLIRQRRYRTLDFLQPLWNFCATGGPPFPPLAPELAVHLRAELRPEIEALEVLLQRDLSSWKENPRHAA